MKGVLDKTGVSEGRMA